MYRISSVLLVLGLIVSAFCVNGCVINVACNAPQVESSRSVQLSSPINEGAEFKAVTHNGSITIEAGQVDRCDMEAKITARAETEDIASGLAEQVVVTLETVAEGLVVKIEKPKLKQNQSIGVSIGVTLPRNVDLNLKTHNGGVEITGIQGDLEAVTHNGRIAGSDLNGEVKLETHNGKILCRDFTGNARLLTYNGSVEISYLDSAPGQLETSAETHNGSVEFKAPPNLSAKVDLSTHNGSIHTDIPILTVGEISKSKIRGTVGDGAGKLHILTYNGSIRLK